MNKNKIALGQKGFTFIELLVTVGIIGILAIIAIPSYLSYVTKAGRSDAKTSLLNLANLLERYYSQKNTYVGATIANLGLTNPTSGGYYNLEIANITATTYTIQAVPQGRQAANDTQCATFTYNQLGQRGITGNSTIAQCW